MKVTKHSDAAKVDLLKRLNEDVFRLHHQGQFTQASYAADYAIQKAREEFGQDHVSLASAYANRGFIAKELGEMDDAVELYELALNVYEKQEQNIHGKTIVLQNLGNVLRTLSNDPKQVKNKSQLRARAKSVLEQAVNTIRDSDGQKSLKYASALQKLANLNKDLGEFASAEQLLREAITITQEVDSSSRVLYSVKNDLGLLLKTRGGAFKEARELYESAVEFAKARFGENNKETIVYKHNLAELLDSNEDTKEEATKLRLSILLSDANAK